MKKDDKTEDWTFRPVRSIQLNGRPINREKDMYPLLEAFLNLEKVYMGIKKGFPDYIVWRDRDLMPPLPGFMEVKRDVGPPTGKMLTRPQRIWFNNLLSAGFRCYVAYLFGGMIEISEVNKGV